MTLADEDTNSILTDNAKRAIQGNVAMHVTHPLVVKFVTSIIGAIWWSKLEPMQVLPSGDQICNQFKWSFLVVTNAMAPFVVNFITSSSGAMWWSNL